MIGNRWFVAGALIAVAFEVPDLWWQAQHGWATVAGSGTAALAPVPERISVVPTPACRSCDLAGSPSAEQSAGVMTGGSRAADRRERAQQRMVVGARKQPRHHRSGRHARTRRYHQLRRARLPQPVLHPRATGGHAVESVRNPQPGMGWPRLRLHRPPPPVGPAMATAAPLRLTPCHQPPSGDASRSVGQQPAQLRCRRFTSARRVGRNHREAVETPGHACNPVLPPAWQIRLA